MFNVKYIKFFLCCHSGPACHSRETCGEPVESSGNPDHGSLLRSCRDDSREGLPRFFRLFMSLCLSVPCLRRGMLRVPCWIRQAHHRLRRGMLCVLVFLCLLVLPASAESPEEICLEAFQETGECPQDLCDVSCEEVLGEDACVDVCVPKTCESFTAKDCPEECAIVINCRGAETCVAAQFSPPSCGETAYEGQDVACCEGLVRRCGIEFFDQTCDMYGDYSVYAYPICIPCGDGVCSNFENRCNCPEDCGKGEAYTGQKYDEELLEEEVEVEVKVEAEKE